MPRLETKALKCPSCVATRVLLGLTVGLCRICYRPISMVSVSDSVCIHSVVVDKARRREVRYV